MRVVVISRKYFSMVEYTANSIIFSETEFSVVDTNNIAHTYRQNEWLLQVIN